VLQKNIFNRLAHFVLILLLGSILSGCVATALIATGVYAASSVVYDHRTLTEMHADNQISNRFLKRITKDPVLAHGVHLNAVTMDRHLLVFGQVSDRKQKKAADQIARSIPGVKRIYNRIEVALSTTSVVRAHDAWVTTKVRAALLAERGLRFVQVTITTDDGVVYLLGIVEPKQAGIITDIASEVSGVRKVVSLFIPPKPDDLQAPIKSADALPSGQ
jgi:osmotically-inducible protein OsmY